MKVEWRPNRKIASEQHLPYEGNIHKDDALTIEIEFQGP